uniref:cyclin-dependent kinase n=1 Tax=Schistocephalus solidus TaxID=70667 RepID=A0A0X3PMD0_SCHSO
MESQSNKQHTRTEIPERRSSGYHGSGRGSEPLQLLQVQEEELDYGEDDELYAPQPSSRSPREEGEALSEDEVLAATVGTSGHRVSSAASRRPPKDREEGEASSDEEQQHRQRNRQHRRDQRHAQSQQRQNKSSREGRHGHSQKRHVPPPPVTELRPRSPSPSPTPAKVPRDPLDDGGEAREAEYRQRLAARQAQRQLDKPTDVVHPLIPLRSKFDSSPESNQEVQEEEQEQEKQVLSREKLKRPPSSAENLLSAKHADIATFEEPRSDLYSQSKRHRPADHPDKSSKAAKKATLPENAFSSQPDLEEFARERLHRHHHGSRSKAPGLEVSASDRRPDRKGQLSGPGSSYLSPAASPQQPQPPEQQHRSMQRRSCSNSSVSRSSSRSPPAHLRNRSRSPPRDRPSANRSGANVAVPKHKPKRPGPLDVVTTVPVKKKHRKQKGRHSSRSSASPSSPSSSSPSLSQLSQNEEPNDRGNREHILQRAPPTEPLGEMLRNPPQRMPIDGSRFKYASSEEEDAEEELEVEEMGVESVEQQAFGVRVPAEDGTKGDVNVLDDLQRERQQQAPIMAQPAKPYYYPSIQGCRSVDEFECLNRIEEGTYGVVYRARDKKTNEIVALKRLKMEKERDGFPITSLREINTLMKAQHENIVTVREVVVGNNMDKIYLVMDYVEHDLKALMEVMSGPFSVGEVKCLLTQLLRAVRHLHNNWILHRDLKTSNLLLSHSGILRVGDFGLAREYGSPLKHYTEVVVTLWYRAPELLLGTKQYSCPIDLWSVGCIFAEFLLQRPLFPGKGEVDELNMIFRDLGTPNERIWPGVTSLPGMKRCVFTEYAYNQLRRRFTEKQISDHGFDLLNSFLTYCPERRITADKALSHPYFSERPRAIDPSMFPTWPAKSEGGKVSSRRVNSPRPPPGGGALAAAAEHRGPSGGASTFSHLGAAFDRLQQPPPPLGGQRFYARSPSRPNTAQGAGSQQPGMGSGGPDQGFLLRF